MGFPVRVPVITVPIPLRENDLSTEIRVGLPSLRSGNVFNADRILSFRLFNPFPVLEEKGMISELAKTLFSIFFLIELIFKLVSLIKSVLVNTTIPFFTPR